MTDQTDQRVTKKLMSMDRRYQENLLFFKQKVPLIFGLLDGCSEKPHVALDPSAQHILRIENGQQVYQTSPLDHAINEVSEFFNSMDGKIYAPTHHTLMLNNLIKKDSFSKTALKYADAIKKEGRENLRSSNIDLVVFGIGMGYHIEMLCNKQRFNNITIIENNVVNLKASMYCVDWKKILTTLKKHSSVTLHICQGEEHQETFKNQLKNHCHRLFPSIGISTLTYNHQPDAKNYKEAKEIIEEYASHVKVSAELIGPEAQRLFNANENVKNGFKCINFKNSNITEGRKVAIVGAGPSLDKYIEVIKENRDQFFLVSSGSALSSITKADLFPDLHFELEFQNLANNLLKHVNETTNLSNLDLVCTYEANPGFPSLFRNAFMFIPESSELQQIFSSDYILRRGGITCTNGATAFVSSLTSQDIYFFGLDFANTNGQHHSKTNISMEDQLPESLNRIKIVSAKRTAMIPVPDTLGGTTYTVMGLNSARITMESLLETIPNKIHNCSAGAAIKGSSYLSVEDLSLSLNEKNSTEYPLNIVVEPIDSQAIHTRTNNILNHSIDFAKNIAENVKLFKSDPKENNRKIKELFSSFTAASNADLGQYRNMMSVSKFPLLQLYIITSFLPEKYQADSVGTWIEEFEEYIEYLSNIFSNANTSHNYLVEHDWID